MGISNSQNMMIFLQSSKLLAQAQHKVALAPRKTLRAHGRGKVSSSSTASQEPQPPGMRLWKKSRPKDLGLRLCPGPHKTLAQALPLGSSFPSLAESQVVPSKLSNALASLWLLGMPIQAGLPSGTAQPHIPPQPQPGLAAAAFRPSQVQRAPETRDFVFQPDPAQIPQQHRISPSAGPGREGRGWRRKGTGEDEGHSPYISTSETPVVPTQVCGCSSPLLCGPRTTQDQRKRPRVHCPFLGTLFVLFKFKSHLSQERGKDTDRMESGC